MDALLDLLSSLLNVLQSLRDVVVNLVRVVLPWLPLFAWLAFWSLAVNWVKAFDVIRRGGYIGIVLLMVVAVMVWAAVAPPVDGVHSLFGLKLSNHAGKFVYVTVLTCMAFLCGSAQMSGAFGRFAFFNDDSEPEGAVHHAH